MFSNIFNKLEESIEKWKFNSFRGHNGPVSMVTIFTNILQQEHLFGLWRGMVPVSISLLCILYLFISYKIYSGNLNI